MLTNVDNTIQGRGNVGAGLIQIINESGGTIDGNSDGGILSVGAKSGVTSVNRGLFTASNGGDLSVVSGEFDNSDGEIESQDGSTVTIGGTAQIVGGIFDAHDNSSIRFSGSSEVVDATLQGGETGQYSALFGSATLTDVVNQSSIMVENAGNLFLNNSMTNEGDLSIGGTNAATDLQIDEAVTLDGGGTVTLTHSSLSRITDDDGGGVLTNVDNTIQGRGQVGIDAVQIINESGGTIDANSSGGTLTLDPGTGAALFNRGVLTASTGGNLRLNAGDYDNTDGLIEVGDDANITLVTGSKVTGGVVRDNSTGSFVMSGTGTLEDLKIEGQMDVQNAGNLALIGTIENEGDIAIGGTNAATDLQIDEAVSLSGGGTVTLSHVSLSRITDDNGGGVLTNVDNTIQGRGNVGSDLVQIENLVLGTIQSDSGSTLLVDSAATTFDNFGLLSAINNSVLEVRDTTTNFGIVDAQAGSRVEFDTLINGAGGELTGDGNIDALGEIINDGTISPGNSPGMLTLETDLMLGSSSTLEIELASLSMFDELIINGDLVLGGELELALLDGYTPGETDIFDVVMADTISGFFANVSDGSRLLTTDGLGSFQVNYGGSGSVQLSQFQVSAVPEPGAATILMAVCVGLLARRRRA